MAKKIIILASGGGTNAENIIRYFSTTQEINVHSVLCNKKEAGVFQRLKPFGIACLWFDASKPAFLSSYLLKHQPDLIVLAGYLRKIPESITTAFPNKIINIHPALLPKYGGKGMYGMYVHTAVKNAEEVKTGITIHYVNEHYDEGGIIVQEEVAIASNDTPTQIAAKVQQLEYKHFPKVIEELLR